MKALNLLLVLILIVSISCKKSNKEENTDKAVIAEQTKGFDKKLNSAEFKDSIENKEVQLIDIRTPKEFEEGHIVNARNIDFYDDDFMKQMAKELDKAEPVYLYCRSGGRSGKAATQLSEQGFKIYDLKGGILAWKAQNFEIEK